MRPFDVVLIASSLAALIAWAALGMYVLTIDQRRRTARANLNAIADILRREDVRSLPIAERVAGVRPILARSSRDMLLRAAAEAATDDVFAPVADYVAGRWGIERLVRNAESHVGRRAKWRRMAALRILSRMAHPGVFDLLARAIEQRDEDVAEVALSLLGSSDDERAVDLLINAIKSRSHHPARIAVYLERSQRPIAPQLRTLLGDADPMTRAWGAMLLAGHADPHEIERDLTPLASDTDPNVRKAALVSLARTDGIDAALVAHERLTDPVPFVRAQAARTLAALDRVDFAADVAPLLGDRDWWVRFAAKQSLETMGSEVWPVLVRLLEDSDLFVRNGAAEVFQNLGILDNLVMMEAVTDDPSERSVNMLRRIAAAGGIGLTESLLERAGPAVAPRIRNILERMGLQQVGVPS